jgi:hypothetical protein
VPLGKSRTGSNIPALQVIVWREILVLIDDGRASAADYDALKSYASRLGSEADLACLTVVPVDSKPPSEEARRAVRTHLEALRPRCFCWHVEATGLHGATVRAILSGFRLFTLHRYPTQIASSLEEALRWVISQLHGRLADEAEVREACAHIRAHRVNAPPPAR